MDYAALLKPPSFAISKVGDPEQLLQDFTEYVKTFKKFVLATGVGGVHTVDHAACGACNKLKATLELVGGKDMCVLYEHVGVVVDEDTFDAAITKIEAGIKGQTNQATARFKLFTKMPQGGLTFGEWYPKVKDQAERCIWTNYDAKQAARDAILFQTVSPSVEEQDCLSPLGASSSTFVSLALRSIGTVSLTLFIPSTGALISTTSFSFMVST